LSVKDESILKRCREKKFQAFRPNIHATRKRKSFSESIIKRATTIGVSSLEHREDHLDKEKE